MKIKICIVGAGIIAQEYLKVLKDIKNLNVLGIYCCWIWR